MLVLFFSCPVILSKPLNCPRGLTFFTCKNNWFTHLFMNVARIRCKNRSWFFEKCLLVLLPLVDTLLKSWTFLSCEVEVKVCFLWNIRRHSSKFIWRSSKSVYTHRAFLFFYSVFFWWGAVVVRTIRLCQSCCKGGRVSSKFSSCPEHVLARLTEQKAKQEWVPGRSHWLHRSKPCISS